MDAGNKLSLRVSVAGLNRVVFPNPLNETLVLASERKATVLGDQENDIRMCAQPFGVVRILNHLHLREIVGEIQFHGEESKRVMVVLKDVHLPQYQRI